MAAHAAARKAAEMADGAEQPAEWLINNNAKTRQPLPLPLPSNADAGANKTSRKQ